ncbi:hypothetical protein [Acetobacterium sp.]|uniref:hypothetical protein n=1 Tax=Acetobacterium sp. TaxID=1872094 RepID=UPI002F3EFBB2
MESNTYASTPFNGSYNVRTVLEKSLMTMAESGRQSAVALKEQGMTETEILEALDMDARFEEWLSSVHGQFDTLGISYSDE